MRRRDSTFVRAPGTHRRRSAATGRGRPPAEPRLTRAERQQVAVALTLVQVFFGLHYLAAKVLLEFVPPRAWAAVRVTAAAVVLLAAVKLTGAILPRSWADLRQLAVYALFGVAINQVCFVEGLSRTTPTHSSLVNTTIPVGTLFFATLWGHERFTRYKVISLVLAISGVLLVVRPDAQSLGGGQVLGDVLTLINALSYALFLVISKRYLSTVDPLGATAMMLVLGSVPLLALGAYDLAHFDPSTVPARIWWLGAFIVVFPTAAAYLLNSWALTRVESSLVALFIYLQPVIAVTLAAIVRRELPSAFDLLGGALIFCGVYLTVFRARAARRARHLQEAQLRRDRSSANGGEP